MVYYQIIIIILPTYHDCQKWWLPGEKRVETSFNDCHQFGWADLSLMMVIMMIVMIVMVMMIVMIVMVMMMVMMMLTISTYRESMQQITREEF